MNDWSSDKDLEKEKSQLLLELKREEMDNLQSLKFQQEYTKQ